MKPARPAFFFGVLLLSTLVLCFPVAAFAGNGAEKEDPIGEAHSFLGDLKDSNRAKNHEFEYPFLISQTALVVDKAPAALLKSLKTYLRKGALPFKATGGKTGITAEKVDRTSLALPEPVTQEKQLEGIQKCTPDYCLMKLNTATEKVAVGAAAEKNKLAVYHQLIVDRVKHYLSGRSLLGYEKRDSNESYVKKMVGYLPFLKSLYPKAEKFLAQGMWAKEVPPKELTDGFFRQELIVFGPNRLQPIHRIGEVFEFQEGGGTLLVEVHVYTNHYFDSSMRVFEVRPWKGKSLIIVTDAMEIDELTKSGLIRLLYKGEMEEANSKYQDEELKQVG